jgi:hypothetical protein
MGEAKKLLNNGDVPEAVLNQLSEHTVGGFVLFYFNQETGNPTHVLQFDDSVHGLAMQKNIEDWAEALHQVGIEAMLDGFIPDDGSEGEEEEE